MSSSIANTSKSLDSSLVKVQDKPQASKFTRCCLAVVSAIGTLIKMLFLILVGQALAVGITVLLTFAIGKITYLSPEAQEMTAGIIYLFTCSLLLSPELCLPILNRI